MKKTLSILAIFTVCINSLAESSVVADLKALYKFNKEWQTSPLTLEEQRAYSKKTEDRVGPIVEKEFAKLAEGVVTPLARELLQDPETMDFCRLRLLTQIRTYSPDIQSNAWNTAFQASSYAVRTRLILSFIRVLPKDAFFTKEVQRWLVEKINEGTPAGIFYFLLTDESAESVTETAKTSMKRFSKEREKSDGNLFALLSVVFLATRGNEDAIKLLDSLLDQRDINSLLDTWYVIYAAGMTGNEKLIGKILEIILTDKHSEPIEHSNSFWLPFSGNAVSMCVIAIEGFPNAQIAYENDDEMKEAQKILHNWINANPTYKIKPDLHLTIIQNSHFQSIITAMIRYDERQFQKEVMK